LFIEIFKDYGTIIFKRKCVIFLVMKAKVFRYEGFILVGVLMALGSLGKLIGLYSLSSDWFWFLTGLAFVFEGVISLIKQRRFDRKYKIIER